MFFIRSNKREQTVNEWHKEEESVAITPSSSDSTDGEQAEIFPVRRQWSSQIID